jgi:hypothetical protein
LDADPDPRIRTSDNGSGSGCGSVPKSSVTLGCKKINFFILLKYVS